MLLLYPQHCILILQPGCSRLILCSINIFNILLTYVSYKRTRKWNLCRESVGKSWISIHREVRGHGLVELEVI